MAAAVSNNGVAAVLPPTTPPTAPQTQNRFSYPCLDVTKDYFKQATSPETTCLSVIAKISLVVFPIFMALIALEALFDLIMAPIVFTANCIAGPQEIPTPPAPTTPTPGTDAVVGTASPAPVREVTESKAEETPVVEVPTAAPAAATPTADASSTTVGTTVDAAVIPAAPSEKISETEGKTATPQKTGKQPHHVTKRQRRKRAEQRQQLINARLIAPSEAPKSPTAAAGTPPLADAPKSPKADVTAAGTPPLAEEPKSPKAADAAGVPTPAVDEPKTNLEGKSNLLDKPATPPSSGESKANKPATPPSPGESKANKPKQHTNVQGQKIPPNKVSRHLRNIA